MKTFFIHTTLLVIVLFGLLVLNYFHDVVEQYLAGIPYHTYIVPVVSIAVVVFIVFLFISRDKELTDLKYEFLTIITHKFRTPLTSMRWLVDELQKENIPSAEKKDLLKNAARTVDKLMEVVDSLAGAVRSDHRLEYSFSVVSLRKMLDVSLQKMSQHINEKDINFEISEADGVPYIRADEQKIQFVVDTVLENAVRYTPKGGTIYMALYVKDNKVVLAIQDTGVGLSRQGKRKIFEKFYRSKEARDMDPEGLGVALHLARVIMKKHDGRIRVESPGLGKGTTFYIELGIPK